MEIDSESQRLCWMCVIQIEIIKLWLYHVFVHNSIRLLNKYMNALMFSVRLTFPLWQMSQDNQWFRGLSPGRVIHGSAHMWLLSRNVSQSNGNNSWNARLIKTKERERKHWTYSIHNYVTWIKSNSKSNMNMVAPKKSRARDDKKLQIVFCPNNSGRCIRKQCVIMWTATAV